ncbi:uncharacterized protein EV420DRAFT_1648684 [Desarmillaria tabescens]|uniref:Uncharacterized protein n=1 Tax=Armillaria tabescens TaxID=1929756 RepID=A0AA39JL14_ARMTA|nr:uncharacterized protein EV420DRAFT_1648684 [Desarmillaria tabescens]KAK0444578.1 hypothetical protein EV420DRAFT_1648684 [Desarmillaria tabescens]
MTTSHTLSAKSLQYDNDTFIFSNTVPSYLVVAFNQRLIPLTSALVHRWMSLLDPFTAPFCLFPVTVHRIGIMAYGVRRSSGPPIPEQSTDPLPPGDYGWYLSDRWEHRCLPEAASSIRPKSFLTMKQTASGGHCDPEKMFDVIPEVAHAVMERDRQRCFITGSEANTELVWIFTPYYTRITHHSDPLAVFATPAEFETAPNAAFLHKDLVPFFLDNAFSVDVDDNHRVVLFRNIGPAQSLLPSHLTITNGPDDYYLREHFRLSLRVNLLDCDIRKQYPNGAIFEMMGELGVDYDDPEMEAIVPLSDPRWHTVLGQAILEDIIETGAAAKYRPCDDENMEETD